MDTEIGPNGPSGSPKYAGTIAVKLDDGTTVDATCSATIVKNLKGGGEVKASKTSSGGWEVAGPATK
jgi:hypothetical protein